MSKAMTALKVTPGITYCSSDGVPYRADPSGIIHVYAEHITEINTKSSGHTATATDVGSTSHAGAALVITVG